MIIDRVTSFAEVRKCSTSSNQSVHATKKLVEGEIFAKFGPQKVIDKPNYLTVQVSQSEHIMLDPEWLQYINHSCRPNVFFDTSKREIIVLKSIEVGEEVTFFYPATEWVMDQPFECLCHRENCLKEIQGSKFISPDILMSYRLSSHIQENIERFS